MLEAFESGIGRESRGSEYALSASAPGCENANAAPTHTCSSNSTRKGVIMSRIAYAPKSMEHDCEIFLLAWDQ